MNFDFVQTKRRANAARKRAAVWLTVVVALVAAACAVMLLLSTRQNYAWFLAANCVLTIAAGCLVVWTVTVPLSKFKKLAAACDKMAFGKERVEVGKFVEARFSLENGFDGQKLLFDCHGEEREINAVGAVCALEKGKTYRLCVRANFLTSAEAQDE